MRQRLFSALGAGALAFTVMFAAPVSSAPYRRTVPFALDQWIEIGLRDGAVTIHRLRIERRTGLRGFKSVVTRPAHSEYLQDVQIQVEYTNESTSDWKVRANVVWLDGAGQVIDGYKGSEDLDDGKRHELATMQFSTLKYGLDQGRRLSIDLEVEPD
jgi:hypothetical protein